MAAKCRLDREKLLEKLARIKYEPDTDTDSHQLRKMSMADALLAVTGIDHDSEYALCTKVARHLLGNVPEPDEISMDQE